MKKPYWIAFFSMTGSEIVSISKQIGRWPDRICTNKPIEEIDQINPEILAKDYKKILFLPPKPSSEEYNTTLMVTKRTPKSIITLHGFLRVLPPDICNRYTIYNGHPGDIETYPQLKGFNPQHKAFNLKLKKSYFSYKSPNISSKLIEYHVIIVLVSLIVPTLFVTG